MSQTNALQTHFVGRIRCKQTENNNFLINLISMYKGQLSDS